ncbi:alkyl hydroperoxide reductase/ thiol specific antioxidant/ Mal allergen [Scenedesmus sp. NREL 46B-D3]|nr:alkyl hydroperoxide reductase/ thiol specific antioxidant/ Mal allergen [Scenedesmus sp. NREL 46B-D3]
MVLTESAQMEIGSAAPDFELPEPLTGEVVSLAAASAGAKAVLVMFICNHCPFVVMLKGAIAALAKEYQAKGLAVVAISSNSSQTHPQDGPQQMAEDARANGYTFPYLFDESQAAARAYGAACTPEFFVFGADLRLTYHGQFDDARPNNGKSVTGANLHGVQ